MKYFLYAFAGNLIALRNKKGLTQAQLAKKLGVTETSIRCYEKDRNFPSIDKLINMCNFFNVSLDYLFTEHSEEN